MTEAIGGIPLSCRTELPALYNILGYNICFSHTSSIFFTFNILRVLDILTPCWNYKKSQYLVNSFPAFLVMTNYSWWYFSFLLLSFYLTPKKKVYEAFLIKYILHSITVPTNEFHQCLSRIYHCSGSMQDEFPFNLAISMSCEVQMQLAI